MTEAVQNLSSAQERFQEGVKEVLQEIPPIVIKNSNILTTLDRIIGLKEGDSNEKVDSAVNYFRAIFDAKKATRSEKQAAMDKIVEASKAFAEKKEISLDNVQEIGQEIADGIDSVNEATNLAEANADNSAALMEEAGKLSAKFGNLINSLQDGDQQVQAYSIISDIYESFKGAKGEASLVDVQDAVDQISKIIDEKSFDFQAISAAMKKLDPAVKDVLFKQFFSQVDPQVNLHLGPQLATVCDDNGLEKDRATIGNSLAIVAKSANAIEKDNEILQNPQAYAENRAKLYQSIIEAGQETNQIIQENPSLASKKETILAQKIVEKAEVNEATLYKDELASMSNYLEATKGQDEAKREGGIQDFFKKNMIWLIPALVLGASPVAHIAQYIPLVGGTISKVLGGLASEGLSAGMNFLAMTLGLRGGMAQQGGQAESTEKPQARKQAPQQVAMGA